MTGATVINGGTGYTTAPTCTIAGPTNQPVQDSNRHHPVGRRHAGDLYGSGQLQHNHGHVDGWMATTRQSECRSCCRMTGDGYLRALHADRNNHNDGYRPGVIDRKRMRTGNGNVFHQYRDDNRKKGGYAGNFITTYQ